MSATMREIVTHDAIRTALAVRRDPHDGALPCRNWPDNHPLGYDVWNGMTLCTECANLFDQRGDLWDPENDYYLLGVRSVTIPCRCGNCGDPIGPTTPLGEYDASLNPLCCWCDLPSEGLVDSDSPACGEHLRQYGGSGCKV